MCLRDGLVESTKSLMHCEFPNFKPVHIYCSTIILYKHTTMLPRLQVSREYRKKLNDLCCIYSGSDHS